jgi:uncharacterized coiled-coil protein SlyX
MSVEHLQKQLEVKKLELSVSKAKVVIEELELKIQERMIDVERMREHIKLQQDIVSSCMKQLNQ